MIEKTVITMFPVVFVSHRRSHIAPVQLSKYLLVRSYIGACKFRDNMLSTSSFFCSLFNVLYSSSASVQGRVLLLHYRSLLIDSFGYNCRPRYCDA